MERSGDAKKEWMDQMACAYDEVSGKHEMSKAQLDWMQELQRVVRDSVEIHERNMQSQFPQEFMESIQRRGETAETTASRQWSAGFLTEWQDTEEQKEMPEFLQEDWEKESAMKGAAWDKDWKIYLEAVKEGMRGAKNKTAPLQHLNERPEAWMKSPVDGKYYPRGDKLVLEYVSKVMLRDWNRASLATMASIINTHYSNLKIPRPWIKQSRINATYNVMAKRKRLQKNEISKAKGRMERLEIAPFPLGIAGQLLGRGEQIKDDDDQELKEIALFFQQLISGVHRMFG